MFANKYLYNSLITMISGPHRKRYPQKLIVNSPTEKTEVTLAQLKLNDHNVDGLKFSSTNQANMIDVEIPSNSAVYQKTLLGWKLIADGRLVRSQQPTMQLSLDLAKPIRILANNREFTAMIDEQVELLIGVEPIRFSAVRATLESGILHVILLALVIYGSKISLFKDKDIEIQLEQPQAEVQKITAVELSAAVNASEFSGRNLEMAAVDPAAFQKAQEARAKNISNKLSAVLNKIGSLNLTNLPTVTNDANSEKMRISGIQKLAASLGQSQGNGNGKEVFKPLVGGNIGKGFRWDLAGGSGMEISLKDQEQAGEAFRAMQEQFRNCYETALLKNEELSVVVDYESMINTAGRLGSPMFHISGRSTADSEAQLTGCLSKIINSIKLSKNLAGLKIKNQFIFRN